MEQSIKRKRGRPRKVVETSKEKIKKDEEIKEKKEENIVVFLALSDDESNDNRFTINDTETKIISAVNSISDSESSDYTTEENSENQKFSDSTYDVKLLIEEIKKRDIIINNFRNKSGGLLSSYTTSKQNNINYHCVQLVDYKCGESFVPHVTEIKCWWCDERFDNLPAYIANYYKNGHYYVFGNFCSFNCAAKYNIKMLKDYKCNTRHALTNSLKSKVTGDDKPIKLAPERELLKSKGGIYPIEKFREGFTMISCKSQMDMPPIIPLVHVIEEENKY